MTFTSKQYDTIKWVAQYLLPAAGTLYFALASIWGLPYGEQAVGTITAVDTFLGVIMGLSNKNYEGDGTIRIMGGEPHMTFTDDLKALQGKKSITLRVK